MCHSYGDLSDAQLLQTYGFVEEVPRQPSDASCWYSFREKYLAGGGCEGATPNGVQGEAPGSLRSEEKSAGNCDPSGSVRVETGSAAGGRSMELGSNPNNRVDLPVSALVDACSAVRHWPSRTFLALKCGGMGAIPHISGVEMRWR